MKTILVPCYLRESALHRHDLLKQHFPANTETILDVGGSSYIRIKNTWKKNLGPAGKSWNATYFNANKKGKRRILTLNVTRDYNKNRKPDLYYDGLNIPFNDNSFDVVTSVDVLEHMPNKDRKRVLEEMIRVAKKRIMITFPFKSEKTSLEKEILSYVELHHVEQKASLLEHEEFGLPTIDEIEDYLRNLPYPYEVSFATDREILKHHLFHQGSLNRLLKHTGIDKKSIMKEIRRLEKINYGELKFEQSIPKKRPIE